VTGLGKLATAQPIRAKLDPAQNKQKHAGPGPQAQLA